MQYTPCVEEYFDIDNEIVCWKNKQDLFEKILYYMENEDEREKIAFKGHERAINNHTWTKRFEKIYLFLKEKKHILINIKKNFIISLKKAIRKN